MFENNLVFKKRWKLLDRLIGFKCICDFDINFLVYLYEKEYFFDKGVYYNKEIIFFREIRNDDLY